MLKNAFLGAKIGADTAENEQNFAEMLTNIWQKSDREAPYPYGWTPPEYEELREASRKTCTFAAAWLPETCTPGGSTSYPKPEMSGLYVAPRTIWSKRSRL